MTVGLTRQNCNDPDEHMRRRRLRTSNGVIRASSVEPPTTTCLSAAPPEAGGGGRSAGFLDALTGVGCPGAACSTRAQRHPRKPMLPMPARQLPSGPRPSGVAAFREVLEVVQV
jgi:hypothetical protein